MIRAGRGLVSSSWVRNGLASFSTDADYSQVLNTANQIVPAPETTAKEVGLCAGIPLETYKRKARIFSPARTASQSGQGRTVFNSVSPAWKIAFTTTAKWENPLMGWTSTADPLENVARSSLMFFTPEEAAAFCTRHGWDFEIEYPNAKRTTRQKRFLGYGDNFSVKRKGLPDLSTLRGNRQGGATPAASG